MGCVVIELLYLQSVSYLVSNQCFIGMHLWLDKLFNMHYGTLIFPQLVLMNAVCMLPDKVRGVCPHYLHKLMVV